MDPLKLAKPLAFASAVAALLIVPTTTETTSNPFSTGKACADGTCCSGNAICEHGGHDHQNHYFASGACI
jgi:hypothetical protein